MPSPSMILRLAALVAVAFSAMVGVEYLDTATFCEAGGGCETVRQSAIGQAVGNFLPVLGMVGFGAIFAGSLSRRRRTLVVTSTLAILGATIAGALLASQAALGTFCWLCVGVDSAAIVAGVGGMLVLVTGEGEPGRGDQRIVSPWWAALVLALLGPVAFAATVPDAPVPDGIRAAWDRRPVQVVEIVDFQCPYCRQVHPHIKDALAAVPEEDVNIVRWMVPLFFHQQAEGAARAYVCAEREGLAEEMADHLFTASSLSLGPVTEAAANLGLDREAFEACLEAESTEERLVADIAKARSSLPGSFGLPTVFIGSRAIEGAHPAATYADAVEAAQRGEGRRLRLWPPVALAVFALLIAFVAARMRRRETAPTAPPA